MGEIKNVATLTNDEQANINRAAIEHRATWMGLIYDELKKALIRSRHSEEPSRDAETSTVQTLRLPVPIRMTAGISLRYS